MVVDRKRLTCPPTRAGFLVQAVNPDVPRSSAIGSFQTLPGNSRIFTCSPGYQVPNENETPPERVDRPNTFLVCPKNALTHSDSRGKTSLDVTWEAPRDYQGDVLFVTTFVKDYATFWAQVLD